MTALLTPADVAAALRVRDQRTARRRLQELGVPTVPFGRSYRVRSVDLERAVAVAAVVPAGTTRTTAAGVTLAKGARLWDSDPSNKVAPRRVRARGRGSREVIPDASQSLQGSPDRFSGPSPRAVKREES